MKKLLVAFLCLSLIIGCGHPSENASNNNDSATSQPMATNAPTDAPTDSPTDEPSDGATDAPSDSATDDAGVVNNPGYKWTQISNPCAAVENYIIQSDGEDMVVCKDGSLWKNQKQK